MDVTVYSIQNAVQAYSKQSRVFAGPKEFSAPLNPASFKDKVTLSSEAVSKSSDFQQFIYRKEDIVSIGTKFDK